MTKIPAESAASPHVVARSSSSRDSDESEQRCRGDGGISSTNKKTATRWSFLPGKRKEKKKKKKKKRKREGGERSEGRRAGGSRSRKAGQEGSRSEKRIRTRRRREISEIFHLFCLFFLFLFWSSHPF